MSVWGYSEAMVHVTFKMTKAEKEALDELVRAHPKVKPTRGYYETKPSRGEVIRRAIAAYTPPKEKPKPAPRKRAVPRKPATTTSTTVTPTPPGATVTPARKRPVSRTSGVSR
jgi:hypothetical protein